MRIFLSIVALGLLSACAIGSPQQAQIVTCDSVNAALLTVNALDDKGLVPASSKPSIIQAVALAEPICGQNAKLLSTTTAAIADLTTALTTLQVVIKQANGGA